MSKAGWDYLMEVARMRATATGKRMRVRGVYNINAHHYYYFVMVAK
jgi:hypothetical protein